MRNLEKGQHIFIAFQNRKAVLDSQLRPRMYTSLENADKWTPTVNKGKIEYVEYAPTLTPPNDWISVKDRLPESGQYVAVYSHYFYSIGVWKRYIDTVLMKNFSGKYDRVKVLREEWFVLTEDGDEVLVDDDRVKYWCELPELPEKELREWKEWDKKYGLD